MTLKAVVDMLLTCSLLHYNDYNFPCTDSRFSTMDDWIGMQIALPDVMSVKCANPYL